MRFTQDQALEACIWIRVRRGASDNLEGSILSVERYECSGIQATDAEREDDLRCPTRQSTFAMLIKPSLVRSPTPAHLVFY